MLARAVFERDAKFRACMGAWKADTPTTPMIAAAQVIFILTAKGVSGEKLVLSVLCVRSSSVGRLTIVKTERGSCWLGLHLIGDETGPRYSSSLIIFFFFAFMCVNVLIVMT